MAQTDIKKVLAYSTISQLGFMVASLGIGAYVAAVFHLLTHAFFKALLFLGSGSVIHGMEHGHHAAEHEVGPGHDTGGHEHGGDKPAGPFDPQNMFNMGGLARRMPVTYWTFVIGGFALAGFPLVTAGFWSKDEILADAFAHAPAVFIALALAALMTAFYTMRQISLTFLGQPRTPAAAYASEHAPIFRPMLLALVVLSFFAVGAGWLGIPEHFPVIGGLVPNWIHAYSGGALLERPETLPFSPWPLVTSLVVALGGLLLGWYVYRGYQASQPDPLEAPLGPLYVLLRNKYYFDELYDSLLVRPAYWISDTFVSVWVDRGVIDGTLHLIGRASLRLGEIFRNDFDLPVVNGFGDFVGEGVKRFGRTFRVIQTGQVQQYLLVLMAIIVVLGAVLLLPGLR
jgi:NADH-quinone oxidoreductase subunit L